MEYKLEHFINAKDYLKLRAENGWNVIKEEQVERAVNNSMFNISVFDNDNCIGMGRVVGDNVLKGMLTDVFVSKEYHGKGVGKLIVTTIIKELTDKLNEGDQFQLEASPTNGNRDFYIKCGLKYKPENQDGVYIWLKK